MPAPNNTGKINIRQMYEVEYWTKKLDLTAAELTNIIAKVGDSVDAVRSHIGR